MILRRRNLLRPIADLRRQRGFIINPYAFSSGDPPVSYSTWDSANKDADVTLSNGDNTASVVSAGSSRGAVRGASFNGSGLHYFEVTLDAGNEMLIGLGNSSATITDSYPGANTNSWGYYSVNGQKYTNATNTAYGESWTAGGDKIGCLYDATAGEISFYKNGRFQGVAFTGISGDLYPMWGTATTGAGTRTVTLDTSVPSFGAIYGYWHPTDKDSQITLSNNLNTGTWVAGTGLHGQRGVIGHSSGKHYCELTVTFPAAGVLVGLGNASAALNTYPGANTNSWGYYIDGNKYTNASATAYGATYATGAVIGIDYDASTGTIVFYKNGVSQGTAFTGITAGGALYPMWANAGTGGTFAAVLNHGATAFTGSLPGGSSAWGQIELPAGADAWG